MGDEDVEFYSRVKPGSSYRLLQLTPELLKALESNENQLKLKAPEENGGLLVVCTNEKTFKLRQMNQTNTLLAMKTRLVDDDGDRITDKMSAVAKPLVAFGSIPYFLEPVEISGELQVSKIPKYLGNLKVENNELKIRESVESLKSRSAISDEEFWKTWYYHGGTEIDGVACIIDTRVIKTLLDEILAAIVAEGLSFEQFELEQVYKGLNYEETDDEPMHVINSILLKFCTFKDDIYYSINRQDIVNWIGIHTLREHAIHKPMPLDEFFTEWRRAIPVINSEDWILDLTKLTGNYVCPDNSTIRHLTLQQLPDNAKARFQQLFNIKGRWELDEMVPFIDDLRSKTVKLGSFVMKYARKKTIGNKTIISARDT